jgi:hypothetical protein
MLKLNYHRIRRNRAEGAALIGLTFVRELNGDDRKLCPVGNWCELDDVLIFRRARQQFNIA